jgi:hypothetical protein
MLAPVTAGVLVVVSRLRPQGAERVNASVLSYVSPLSEAKDGVGSSTTDRPSAPAPSVAPGDPGTASIAAAVRDVSAPRCELPVVSVWELPVAREERPQSPWPVYHPPEPEASAIAVESAPPRRARARPKARRSTSIDDLVRKVNAADSKKK